MTSTQISTKFPLTIWQETEEYGVEMKEADKRLGAICDELDKRGFTCTFLGDVRMDADGNPQALLNPKPFGKSKVSSLEAREIALKYGSGGWWSLDELELFSKGGGTIFHSAMWALGYKTTRMPGQWKRLSPEELNRSYPFERKAAPNFETLHSSETERLLSLMALPNEPASLGKSYDIRVGGRGLIHVALNANPFAGTSAEQMGEFYSQLRQRAHITPQQGNYSLFAKNVSLGQQNRAVYIEATNPSGRPWTVEAVWPTTVSRDKLLPLAQDLASRLK